MFLGTSAQVNCLQQFDDLSVLTLLRIPYRECQLSKPDTPRGRHLGWVEMPPSGCASASVKSVARTYHFLALLSFLAYHEQIIFEQFQYPALKACCNYTW